MIPICYFMILYGIDDVEMSRNYLNPRPQDYWSKAWFGLDSSFYDTSASIESWLRTFLMVGEVSSDPGGLEARWIARSMIPAGFLILGIQGVSSIIRELVNLIHPQIHTEEGAE
jgi:TRAP-type mannitol/chloroaromatic compound transport system permease small subunit